MNMLSRATLGRSVSPRRFIISYLQQLYVGLFKMEHTPYKVSTITVPIPAPLLTSALGATSCYHRGHTQGSTMVIWAGGEANHLLSAALGKP